MPGKYTISTAGGLTLKQYVDIEGGGAEGTEITSTVACDSGQPDLNTTATLIVPSTANPAPDAPVSIRDIKISNTSTGGGAALLIRGRATVENVVLESGSPGPYVPGPGQTDCRGAIVRDPGTCATFFNVRVSVTNNPQSSPINPSTADLIGIGFYNSATGKVENSRIAVSGGSDTQGLELSNSGAEVRDSVIEISNVYSGVATQSYGGESRISGSTVRVLSYDGTDIRDRAPAISGYPTVLHSEASVVACPLSSNPPTVDGPCFGCLINGVYQ